MTAVPPRPAAPDATAGDGLREAIAGIWVAGGDDAAEQVLALPALRDVLAAAARDRAALERVKALAEQYLASSVLGLSALAGAGREIRRALDGTL